jgi:hypothetical protein
VFLSECGSPWLAHEEECAIAPIDFLSIFDPDLASRAKYYRTNTAKFTIEQVLMFFK